MATVVAGSTCLGRCRLPLAEAPGGLLGVAERGSGWPLLARPAAQSCAALPLLERALGGHRVTTAWSTPTWEPVWPCASRRLGRRSAGACAWGACGGSLGEAGNPRLGQAVLTVGECRSSFPSLVSASWTQSCPREPRRASLVSSLPGLHFQAPHPWPHFSLSVSLREHGAPSWGQAKRGPRSAEGRGQGLARPAQQGSGRPRVQDPRATAQAAVVGLPPPFGAQLLVPRLVPRGLEGSSGQGANQGGD